jgi:Flp pilus assembly protein TadD
MDMTPIGQNNGSAGGGTVRYRALLWFTVFVLGSSTALAETGGRQISPEELLAGTALDLDPAAPAIITGDEVMALSDDMRAFLEEHVGRRAGNPTKLRLLSDAIFNKKVLGLEYDETTRTAAETFAARAGNCLSFTFMFVVLARGVGLDASFQEVEIPREWSFTGQTSILNRHINIFVDLKIAVNPAKVVDFDIADFRADYDMDIISDQRALAHFFNNLGAQFMHQGDTTAAFHAFKRAISENDASFAPAWDSLGTLYARSGFNYHAEAAFLQALAIDKSDLTAMNNLTVLYDRRGEPELAQRYRNKVNSHRNRNPYYRFQLARMAYRVEDYDQAIDHLKYAVRRRGNDDRFCALLGLVYLEMGAEKKARQWMARAEEYANRESMKRLYSSKIDRLIAASR